MTLEERNKLRQYLRVFYSGSPKKWAKARKKILEMGAIGEEALCIFMIKFFASGKRKIALKNRTYDLGKYWIAARNELKKLGIKAVPYILYAMAHPKMGSSGRNECSITLVRIGSSATPHLINNLYKGRKAFRRSIIQTLGNIGDKKAGKPIGELYQKLRKEVDALKNKNDDGSFGLRYYSIIALGQIKTLKAIPIIKQALSDPNKLIVEQAIIAISKYKKIPSALPVLRKAYKIAKRSFWRYTKKIESTINTIEYH